MKPDPYEQMQMERARQRAAVVRELTAVVNRHGCLASYAPERGVYVSASHKDSRLEWFWSLKSQGAGFDLTIPGAPENAAITLRSLADAFDDPGFAAALAAALERVAPAPVATTHTPRSGFGSGAIDDTKNT